MTIGRKLEIGVGLALASTVAIGIAWLGRLGSLDMDRQSAAEMAARRLRIAAEMDSAGSGMLAAMRGMVLFAAAGEPSQAALCKQEFDSAAGRWWKSAGDLRPLLLQDSERRLVDQMQDRLTAWRSAIAELERAAARGDSDAALKIASGKGYAIYRANARDTARFRQIQDAAPDAQRAGAASVIRADWWTDLGALVMAAGAGLLAFFFARRNGRIPQRAWEQAASSAEAAAPVAGTASPIEVAVPQAGTAQPIDETAFRTDLLSLNAALEAARSGEPARGLPVTADEAVNLVRRSAPVDKTTGPAPDTTGGGYRNASQEPD